MGRDFRTRLCVFFVIFVFFAVLFLSQLGIKPRKNKHTPDPFLFRGFESYERHVWVDWRFCVVRGSFGDSARN